MWPRAHQTHNLGRFRMSLTSITNAVADPIPDNVRTIFSVARDHQGAISVRTEPECGIPEGLRAMVALRHPLMRTAPT